jgi:dTDP-4-amino-4,6-dideoxygalactose transaminase
VFTSPFTFFATAEVIALLGATPVFVDIDPATFNLDPGKLESAIQAVLENDSSLHPLPVYNRTPTPDCRQPAARLRPLTPRAVIPVDLFGLPADYDRINSLAEHHGLRVIEDAAQSLGATYHGRQAGSLGHIGCTSFFPAKPLGGYGDGGAVFTDDDALARELHSIRVHGMGNDKYDNARIGINGRLDTLQAAVLLAKLERFPWEIERRQQAAEWYTEHVQAVLKTPAVPRSRTSVWAQYALLAQDSEHRRALQEGLQAQRIPSAIYYPKPLHVQSAFAPLGYQPGDMPVSEDCAARIFSVPLHPYLTEAEQHKVVQCLQAGRP